MQIFVIISITLTTYCWSVLLWFVSAADVVVTATSAEAIDNDVYNVTGDNNNWAQLFTSDDAQQEIHTIQEEYVIVKSIETTGTRTGTEDDRAVGSSTTTTLSATKSSSSTTVINDDHDDVLLSATILWLENKIELIKDYIQKPSKQFLPFSSSSSSSSTIQEKKKSYGDDNEIKNTNDDHDKNDENQDISSSTSNTRESDAPDISSTFVNDGDAILSVLQEIQNQFHPSNNNDEFVSTIVNNYLLLQHNIRELWGLLSLLIGGGIIHYNGSEDDGDVSKLYEVQDDYEGFLSMLKTNEIESQSALTISMIMKALKAQINPNNNDGTKLHDLYDSLATKSIVILQGKEEEGEEEDESIRKNNVLTMLVEEYIYSSNNFELDDPIDYNKEEMESYLQEKDDAIQSVNTKRLSLMKALQSVLNGNRIAQRYYALKFSKENFDPSYYLSKSLHEYYIHHYRLSIQQSTTTTRNKAVVNLFGDINTSFHQLFDHFSRLNWSEYDKYAPKEDEVGKVTILRIIDDETVKQLVSLANNTVSDVIQKRYNQNQNNNHHQNQIKTQSDNDDDNVDKAIIDSFSSGIWCYSLIQILSLRVNSIDDDAIRKIKDDSTKLDEMILETLVTLAPYCVTTANYNQYQFGDSRSNNIIVINHKFHKTSVTVLREYIAQLVRILVPPDKNGNSVITNLDDTLAKHTQMNPNSTLPKRIKLTQTLLMEKLKFDKKERKKD